MLKRVVWEFFLLISWMLVISTMMFTLTTSPLALMVWAGTASWKQIIFFSITLIAPAVLATELIESRRRLREL
jgi:hypothetical protein